MQSNFFSHLPVFFRVADEDRHSSHWTDPLTPKSLCSRWPERLTRGKVSKNTQPPMATSGTALLFHIYNAPNKTKLILSLSVTLSHQKKHCDVS